MAAVYQLAEEYFRAVLASMARGFPGAHRRCGSLAEEEEAAGLPGL